MTRTQLVERAKVTSKYQFLNSLTPEEYRELTFFWGSCVEFWETVSANAKLGQSDKPSHVATVLP